MSEARPKRPMLSAPIAPSAFVPLRFIVVGVLSLFLAVGLISTKPSVLATDYSSEVLKSDLARQVFVMPTTAI